MNTSLPTVGGSGENWVDTVFLVETVDDHVKVGAFSDILCDQLVKVRGEDMYDFWYDLTAGGRLLDGMPGRHNIPVMQMETGAADLDFPRLLRCPGILRVFQDPDGGSFGAFDRLSLLVGSTDGHRGIQCGKNQCAG